MHHNMDYESSDGLTRYNVQVKKSKRKSKKSKTKSNIEREPFVYAFVFNANRYKNFRKRFGMYLDMVIESPVKDQSNCVHA